MKIALFYHSLRSDWNHGNAHFLRGYASELVARGHEVVVYEPHLSWSLQHLLADHGDAPLRRFAQAYPTLASRGYDHLNLEQELEGVSLIIAHEWNSPELIEKLGKLRRRRPEMRLVFHDTHHRAVTAPKEIEALELSDYDGVLAYGQILADLYRANQWAAKAWTWHEAADPRIFYPRPGIRRVHDLVWVGNWGDGERAQEIRRFLIEPSRALSLDASVYGVRYPEEARQQLHEAGIAYHGWVENFRVPEIFAAHLVTVHIPRGPYARQLHGIPTIRPFEALACGIPLVTAPWSDAEGLFTPGEDYLVANSEAEMTEQLLTVLKKPALATKLAERGLATVLARHTCRHRVDELLSICSQLGLHSD